jgi:anti-sigma B factor antagonist
MEVGIEIKERFSLVHVDGDMSEGDLEKISHAIETLMKKGYLHVVLDLTNVKYMNANGLGTLVNHWTHIRFKRGDLRIVGLNSRLMHLFRTMGLDMIFDIYQSVAEMMEKTGRLPAIA